MDLGNIWCLQSIVVCRVDVCVMRSKENKYMCVILFICLNAIVRVCD